MQLLWSNMYPQSELDNYKLQVDLLQEKLKQSEENRQQLQKELQHILQRRSEHDKSARAKIRQKYQSFLDEQERRNERNQLLMQMLERIDQQSTALSARSERLKMMKLQYERYFAKLMQAQPVRCIQNVGVTSGSTAEVMPMSAVPTAAPIPVLLPAVATQTPNAMLPTATTGGEAAAAAPSIQPMAATMEAVTAAAQSAALTPRMWTFAMATPTTAGLLLTGAPTAAMGAAPLQSTVAPFLQYPLGYGSLFQQPLQQQQQLQMSFAGVPTATTRSVGVINRADFPQSCDVEKTENPLSGLRKYGTTENSNAIDATETTALQMLSIPACETGATPKQQQAKQYEHSPQDASSIDARPEEKVGYAVPPAEAHISPRELTEFPALDKQSEHQSDFNTSIKTTEYPAAGATTEPSFTTSEVLNSNSDIQLEDANSPEDSMSYAKLNDDYEIPKLDAPTSGSSEETFNNPRSFLSSTNSWQKKGPATLNTAEEHMRKFAEIDQKYGTADTVAYSQGSSNVDNNAALTEFKRFSEIINPKQKGTEEAPPKALENVDNQSWQSHSGSMEYTPKPTTSNTSALPKQVSIDNIENAIYGELVNPQINEAPTLSSTAQGFFTELLGQQEPSEVSDSLQESSAKEQQNASADGVEVPTLSATTDNMPMGYANYNPSIDGNEASQMSTEQFTNDVNNSNVNDPQNQTPYDTPNPDLYQQPIPTEGAYGNVETGNEYSDYKTNQAADTIAGNSSSDQQLQEQPQDYTQQDYGNYDASQYGNYDPNAYPGYIYDQVTGQYIADPNYVAAEGSNAEAAYATQDYSEQLPQEQLNYQSSQGQEANYAYEDNTYGTTAPVTPQNAEVSATPATADVATLPAPEPDTTPAPAPIESVAEPPPTSTPKVLKPTSILSTAEKHAAQTDAQKKKKRVNFVDSSETDDSSSAKLPGPGAVGSESDFDFSSGAETSGG
ncbi:uncharacterized protein LOC128857079 [Anastrepha ludens]|uniref:uncharacterized protein LOC128857079 n=1 Tax=Anastrepha ludens TaxID=28586 RepID=UPI0023B19D13|nr:uncharacterized protein LOC128857079 [Anastrepha ludens]